MPLRRPDKQLGRGALQADTAERELDRATLDSNALPLSSDFDCAAVGVLVVARHRTNPPLWALGEMHQPILGLDTAPRPLRLMIWT